jgi:hypothetical protein
MTEWRDTYEQLPYGDRAEYTELSNGDLVSLSERLDDVFTGHIPGLIDGKYEYTNEVQRIAYEYSDATSNARGELVVADTLFELEYRKHEHGPFIETYKVNIARQLDIDPINVRKFVHAAFIEHYTVLVDRGHVRQAYVDRLDLTKGHGEMNETPMTVYEQTHLAKELDKIAALYAIAKQERAIIEQ